MGNRVYPTLADYRGKYAQGWTPDDLEVGLRDLSALLGVELICVWQGDDEGLFAGDSDLYVVNDGMVEDVGASGALFGFIVDGEGRPEDVVKAIEGRPVNAERRGEFSALRSDPLFRRNFAWGR